MRLILADTVHAALVDDDLVLLDVAADAYFCLPAGHQRVTLTGRHMTVDPPALGRALFDAGLTDIDDERLDLRVNSADDPGRTIVRPQRTARAALDDCPSLKLAKTRVAHVVALDRAVRTALAARPLSFADRLAPSDGPPSNLTPELLGDLAVYRRLSPWLPIDGRCLFRSEMLRAYLRALGHEVTWVFGVRTWPFRAHCWLQVEDVALDDEAERLAAYQPIMAV